MDKKIYKQIFINLIKIQEDYYGINIDIMKLIINLNLLMHKNNI